MKRFYEKLNKLRGGRELCLFTILYTCFILLFFTVLKLWNTGYHLVDDKDFLYYHDLIRAGGRTLKEAADEVIGQDMSYRFRPVWAAVRFYTSIWFGVKLMPYTIMRVIQLIISMVALHMTARRRHHSVLASCLFVLISQVGYQSCNWWKLGTPEIRAVMIFALGMWCLVKWLDEGKRLFAGLSILLFTDMALSKENFILILPFVMLYVIYYELTEHRQEGEPVFTWKRLGNALLRYKFLLLFYGVLFVVCILYILTHLSTDNYTVSFSGESHLQEYLEANRNAIATDLKWFCRFMVLFGCIMLTFWEQLKRRWMEMLVALSFILPQIAIYFSTGITERYILPVSIGYAYFFVLVALRKGFLQGKRKYLYIAGLCLLLLAHLRVAVREADYYRWRGNSVQTALDTALTMSQENPKLKVLCGLNPNVEADDTLYYHQLYHGFDNVYIWRYEKETVDGTKLGFYDQMYLNEEPGVNRPEDMDLIIAYNREDRHWCHDIEQELDLSDYDRYDCGTLYVYAKKEMKEQVPAINVQGLRIGF